MSNKPKIVCLCGSTKFKDAFIEAQLKETLKGKIVLTIGCTTHSDPEIFSRLEFEEFQEIKRDLDWLHFEKIKMSDEILVLDVGGYIGASTCDEIGCAMAWEKEIRYLSKEHEV